MQTYTHGASRPPLTLLQRSLLYTAITWAKELVVLVGTKKAIAIAVRNDKIAKRNSRLAQRLSAV